MEQNRMIKLDGNECYILVDEVIQENRYLYVAEIEDGDTTGNFYLYRVIDENDYEKIVDPDILKTILPIIISIMSNNM